MVLILFTLLLALQDSFEREKHSTCFGVEKEFEHVLMLKNNYFGQVPLFNSRCALFIREQKHFGNFAIEFWSFLLFSWQIEMKCDKCDMTIFKTIRCKITKMRAKTLKSVQKHWNQLYDCWKVWINMWRDMNLIAIHLNHSKWLMCRNWVRSKWDMINDLMCRLFAFDFIISIF